MFEYIAALTIIVLIVFLCYHYKCSVWDGVIIGLVISFMISLFYVWLFVDYEAQGHFQKYGLREAYQKLDGFAVDPKDPTFTYGEVLCRGMKTLKAIADSYNITTFVDMGSGVGKGVFLAKILGFDKCIGIEYIDVRHKQAVEFWEKLPKEMSRDIELIHGDMYTDIDFKEIADRDKPMMIYASNLVWSNDMNTRFFKKLGRECSPGTIIVTSKDSPDSSDSPHNIEMIRESTIAMSWDGRSKIYIKKVHDLYK